MAYDWTYYFKGDNFHIENGILRGCEVPYLSTHTSYGELILERLKSHPEFVGQIEGVTGREETFAMMLEKSVKCAVWLRNENVEAGDIVGICTHNQMDMYVPLLAALYIGAIVNPWCHAQLGHDEAKHFLNLTSPKVVFASEESVKTTSESSREIGGTRKIVVFGNVAGFQSLDDIFMSMDGKFVGEFQCTKLSSVDEPALISYTSGTTGLPKGVLLSHRSLFGSLNVAGKDAGGNEKVMTSINFTSISWISGVLTILRSISAMRRRIVCSVFSEEKTLQLIEKYQVNLLPMATSMAFRLQKSPAIGNYDLSSLKCIYIGGAAMEKETQQAIAKSFPRTIVLQGYGITELGGLGLQQSTNFKPGSAGRLVQNLTMKVIDPESGRILSPNESGEACFKSPSMMTGYYRNLEETKKTIDSEGWFHTGDLAHYDEEGNVFVTNRMTDLIKWRDHRIVPSKIEQVLQMHPGVKESAVVGIPDEVDGELPAAFVAKNSNSNVTKDELQKFVTDALPEHMKLRGGVIFLDQLPHTPSGNKIGRAQLKQLAKSYAC